MYFLRPVFTLITFLLLTLICSFCSNPTDPEQLARKKCKTAPQQVNVSASEKSADFQVTFIATWSKTTHPTNFPNGPHFSPLSGAVHTSDISRPIWKTGLMASEGIKLMAETGSPKTLNTEIQNLGDKADYISKEEAISAPGEAEVSFTATSKKNRLTLVSMLAPSHDWFVGITNSSLIEENNQWIDEKVIDLRLYDAGTEDGDDFSMDGSSSTSPKEIISRVQTSAQDTNFGNSGSEPGEPFVGRFLICRK